MQLLAIRAAALAAAVTTLGACATMAPARSGEEMIAAARALDADWYEAFHRGDVGAMLALYWRSPEYVSFPPETFELRGYDAIAASLSPEAFAQMGEYHLEPIEATYRVHGDAVVTYGTWRFTGVGLDGEPIEMVGRFTDVKAERDGRWVYIHDHTSLPTSEE